MAKAPTPPPDVSGAALWLRSRWHRHSTAVPTSTSAAPGSAAPTHRVRRGRDRAGAALVGTMAMQSRSCATGTDIPAASRSGWADLRGVLRARGRDPRAAGHGGDAEPLIRAKAVSAKEVDSGNDIYGNPIKRIQYEVKQIKMFKGPDQDIEFIYTAPSTAVCGQPLDTGGKKEYLIAGKSEGDGKMHITLCDLVATWDSLSPTQKKSLNQRYQMGCECKISRCLSIPCFVSSSDECLWTDWAMEKIVGGRQAKHYACIKRSDGSCAWYRGMAPPKQEFLDIEDP
ncbi:metalloproteinase inhibitor 2 isoform X1 [Gallus gallus]|uniref:metalloproteinase inhibitor 2 isoform X1 n=1 Tax=Gallus gallus TaxID=9031 RepID=UPI001F0167A8|nr:metalloproteinase inhibitor 2 isoform X1 [Gallus gallus]